MAGTATAKKPKEKTSFFVPKWDWNEAGIRAGKAVARGGGYVGISALSNMDYIKTKKIRKHMGWMSIVAGLGLEMVTNNANGAARVVSGLGEGLTLWGMVDTAGTLLGENAKAKLGLAGLGASAAERDQPKDQSGIDWFALADEADAKSDGPADEAQAAPQRATMRGIEDGGSTALELFNA